MSCSRCGEFGWVIIGNEVCDNGPGSNAVCNYTSYEDYYGF